MFGVTYLAASDFSLFSYPRSPCSSPICLEPHNTSIEERYCAGQHAHNFCDDTEWDLLLARSAQLFADVEEKMLDMYPRKLDGLTICTDETDVHIRPDDLVYAYHSSDSNAEGSAGHPSDVINQEFEDNSNCTTAVDTCATLNSALGNANIGCDTTESDNPAMSFPTSRAREDAPEIESNPEEIGLSSRRTSSRILQSATRKEESQSAPFSAPSSSTKEYSRKRKRGHFNSTSTPTTPAPSDHSATSTPFSSLGTGSTIDPTESPYPNTVSKRRSSPSTSETDWKCPYCPWIQRSQRQPDFLRHQRSHFISQTDWPCPNRKCGKSFARKDSLKRHLNNRAKRCKRPPGYTVC